MQTGGATIPVVLANTGLVSQQNVYYPNFKKHPHMELATTQLVLGVLCIGVNIGALVLHAALSDISIGIWGGVFIVTTGLIGIGAALKKNSCTIVATLVLSIIAALMGAGILINSSIGLAKDYEIYCFFCEYYDVRLDMNLFLVVLGLGEMVIAIIQVVFCCKGMATRSGQHGAHVNNGFSHQLVVNTQNDQHMFAYPDVNQQEYVCIKGEMVPVQLDGAQIGPFTAQGATAAQPGSQQTPPPAYSPLKPA